MASRRRLDEPPRTPEEAREQIKRLERAVARLESQLRSMAAETQRLEAQEKKEAAAAKAAQRAGRPASSARAERRRKIKRRLAAIRPKQEEVSGQIVHLEKCKSTWQAEQFWRKKEEASKRASDSRLRRKEARRHRAWHGYLDARSLNLSLPPELAVPVPPLPEVRLYPWPELERVSEWVCVWLLRNLREIADSLGGVAYVYRYPESLEVDGRVIFKLPEESDRSEDAAMVADAFAQLSQDVDFEVEKGASKRVVETLYFHELWVQGVVVAIAKPGYENDSPKDRSRVLPGGLQEMQMDSHWRRGDLAGPIETMFEIETNFREAIEDRGDEDEVRVEAFELRFHWGPSNDRPDRSRQEAEETNCELTP